MGRDKNGHPNPGFTMILPAIDVFDWISYNRAMEIELAGRIVTTAGNHG